MKLNMHNVIASAIILCTALLVSFCNAYPYPVYWDREAFLEQLQQEERVGANVEARIEQEEECPLPNTIFNFTNADPSETRILRDTITGDILGSEFDYKCQSGFVLFISKKEGTYERASLYLIKYECLRSTGSTFNHSITENGRPKCFRLCPELPKILSNGAVTVTGREPGDTASYSCDPDYDLSGPQTRTCGQDGRWSGQEPRCVALCPELPSISNGAVRVTGREPGATASYSCDPGYDLSGARIRICNQDGRWSGQEPTCETEECPPPNTIFNFTNADPSREQLLRDTITGNTLGSHFNYKCQSGFVLFVSKNGGAYERASSDSITYECLRSTGSTFNRSIMENGRPKCFPLCPELPSVLSNGTVSITGREPGDNATYSCRPHYRLKGPEKRTCGQDGKWSGDEEPVCEGFRLCPRLQSIPNGAVNFTDLTKPGAIATYSCLEDYYLSGEQTRVCGQDGKWSCKEPTCFPLCPIPKLPYGLVTYGNRTPGDVANYSCRYGYQLKGPKNRTCGQDQDGEWSGKEPVCIAIICPLVNPIPNGDRRPSSPPITLSDGRVGFPVDTVITYTCRPYFELQGESTRTCLESGEWDPRPEPHCGFPLCPIPSLPNGRVNHGDREPGDIAVYSCRYGYRLVGPEKRTCRQNRTWSGEEPVCQAIPKCPELKLFDLPKNVPEVDRKLKRYRNYQQLRYQRYYNRRIEGDRSEGSKAYLTCLEPWQLLEGTPAIQTCISVNGELVWTEAGTCVFYYSYPSNG